MKVCPKLRVNLIFKLDVKFTSRGGGPCIGPEEVVGSCGSGKLCMTVP